MEDGTRLCLSCAMCCDSTLFFHGKLTGDERDEAAARGFDVIEAEGNPQFRQPCHQLDGKRCAGFGDWRPEVCGSFRCKLLGRLDDGEVGIDAAIGTVEKARALLSRLPPDLRTLRAMRGYADRAQAKMQEGALGKEEAQTMMAVVVALRYLDTEFRKSGKEILSG